MSGQPPRGPLAAEFETAAAIIRDAAARARQAQDTLLDVAMKSGPADLVSEVDRELDALIVSRLLDRFPADGSLSEEAGRRPGTSGRTWLVDPIDGTHNYVAGLPHYAISIALTEGSRTLLGLVHDASNGEVHAASAAAARADGGAGRLAVPSSLVAVNLPAAAVFAGSGLRSPLDRIGDIRMTGSLCLDLAWTSAGRYDACVYRHRDNPWDWAAGELIARSRGKSVIRAQWGTDTVMVVGRPDVAAVLADGDRHVASRRPGAE